MIDAQKIKEKEKDKEVNYINVYILFKFTIELLIEAITYFFEYILTNYFLPG